MLQRWLIVSLFTAVPQKGVNNHMEVNDRPIQSGSDDENTTKASKAEVLLSRRLFTGIWFIFYFKMSLNSGGTFAHCLCLFFNELEVRIKIARSNGHWFLDFTFNSFVLSKVVLLAQLLHKTS